MRMKTMRPVEIFDRTANNLIIRKALRRYKLKQWQAAKIIGIGESTFTRRMREEMPAETQMLIVEKIREHLGKGEDDEENDE